MANCVWTREIEGIQCPKCHCDLIFDMESIFRPSSDEAYISMRCSICGRDNYRVTVRKNSTNTFNRKKTNHEGARAAYDAAYSYLRFHTRLRHFQVSAFVMERRLGIPLEIAQDAVESYEDSFYCDKLGLSTAKTIFQNEPYDLPF